MFIFQWIQYWNIFFFESVFFCRKRCYQLSTYVHFLIVETGLSDFHLMTLTVVRKRFKKTKPKTINYRSYKNFSNEEYRDTLIENLPEENLINNDDGFQRFCHMSLDALINMHHVRRSMFEVIRCSSLIKNCRKQNDTN